MKPMIKYRGGKSKEIPHLLWHIPRFKGRYIEPFFGGGAMFFHLEPREAIINDINKKLMDFYIGVRNEFPILRNELDQIEDIYENNRKEFEALKSLNPQQRVHDKNEDLYYHIRAQFNGLEKKMFSDALLYFYINKTAYSGMIRYNANGEFNVPYGRYQHLNTGCVTLSHSRLLQRAEVYNEDYSIIFNMCTEDDFLFLDPPYDCSFTDYGNDEYRDGFNEDSHRRLAEDFRNLPCKALMVIGKTLLTEELYRNSIIEEYEKSYAVNIRNRFKAGATHIVVANYRKDMDMQDAKPVNYTYSEPEIASLLLFERRAKYGKN